MFAFMTKKVVFYAGFSKLRLMVETMEHAKKEDGAGEI
jgi:hypothetical protein